ESRRPDRRGPHRAARRPARGTPTLWYTHHRFLSEEPSIGRRYSRESGPLRFHRNDGGNIRPARVLQRCAARPSKPQAFLDATARSLAGVAGASLAADARRLITGSYT